jgi:Zn-finger nucleic acid-binding protein
MKCPKCEANLESKTFKKVNIHECGTCSGLWFDKDELNRAKDSTDEDLAWLDFDIFEEKESKYSKKESGRVCPRDNSNLVTLIYSDSKINIDACPTCHGTWLDREEFEKIIKYLEDKVVSETSGEYAKDLVHQFTQILTGPTHLASEVKDFMAVLRLFEKRLEAEHPNITYALSNFPIR